MKESKDKVLFHPSYEEPLVFYKHVLKKVKGKLALVSQTK